ncbi:MAG: hypothetical protein PVI54_00930 [Desulfobacteraceae bacterium]|jgi:hypothetical protein
MSRRRKGHFRDKHPADISIDPAVAAAVSSNLDHHKITCIAAFEIADKLSVAPMTVGTAIDLQQGRIVGCQLGLFGYGERKKLLDHPHDIDKSVQGIIQASLTQERLTCEKAWRIADSQSLPRLEIARLCQSMGVRICQCQLGAFK